MKDTNNTIMRLQGHSGCKVYLLQENDDLFVRKISRNKNYNKRLKIQMEKQNAFCSELIYTPKIYRWGKTEEGFFYYDMEYVDGITLAELIKTIEPGKIRSYVETIVEEVFIREPDVDANTNENAFENKINELRNILKESRNGAVDKALEMLAEHQWDDIPNNICHGDLTMENIIIQNERIWLIDFQDSFYDSLFIDAGALIQDAWLLWSYRYEKKVDVNTVIRNAIFYDSLMKKIEQMYPNNYIETYYILLLKLIRIYPYACDDQTYDFLNINIQKVMDYIKENE